MSPEGDHKLVYTAPWDFDNAFSGRTSGMYVMNNDNPWYVLFNYQDWFWELVNERWDEAMEAGVFTGVIEMLDTVTEVNAEAYDKNSERWSSQSDWGGGWGKQLPLRLRRVLRRKRERPCPGGAIPSELDRVEDQLG